MRARVCCVCVSPRLLQALLAEYLGTMLLVLTISLSSQVPEGYIAIGFTLGALIYSLDHISGAHFNPAVTFGALLNRKISIVDAILTVGVQVLGGFSGGLLALAISTSSNIKPFTPAGDAPWGSLGSAFAVEFLYTFALCLVMQNAAMEKNGREPNSYFGLAVSFTVMAGAKAVGPISGGCFNPAVGTGLDVASLVQSNGSLQFLWVYWVAPLLGAAAASGTKMYMNLPSHQEAEGLPLVVPLTEFLGTFFLVLTIALTGDGLAVGAILIAMVYMVRALRLGGDSVFSPPDSLPSLSAVRPLCFPTTPSPQGDHVCGADYNPAITFGVALRMGVPLREYWKVLLTFAAQFAGAFGAAGIAYFVSGDVNYPSDDGVHGVVGAFVFEMIWTALLVYVVCAVMTPTQGEEEAAAEERRGHSRSFQGLAIGFVVTGGIYCGTKTGGGSGGVFNPAAGAAVMTLNAAVLGGSLSSMWVYFAGPFAGGIIGAGVFTLLHYHSDPLMGGFQDLGQEEAFEPSFYG